MMEMVWDVEMEAIAQRWTDQVSFSSKRGEIFHYHVDQCDFGHDSNRKLLDGSYCGQNAASGYSTSGAAVQVEVVSLLLRLLHLLLLAIHFLAGLV